MTRTARIRPVVALLVGALVASLAVLAPPPADGAVASGRLAGDDRYATAVAIGTEAFPDGATVVYLARSDVFSDALAAGTLTDGPVLLVPSCGDVPASVGDAVTAMDPVEVVALGGTTAICDEVLEELGRGRDTSRLAGETRYDTAAAIAARAWPDGATVVHIASSSPTSPDAVVGGVLRGGPVLPVPPNGPVPDAVRDAIEALSPARVLALGGPVAVSDDVLTAAAAGRRVGRVAGDDRIATSVAVALQEFPQGPVASLYLARSDVFADAVAGGALRDGPIVLVPTCGEVPRAVADAVAATRPARVVALGGPVAVCDELLEAVAGLGTDPDMVVGDDVVGTSSFVYGPDTRPLGESALDGIVDVIELDNGDLVVTWDAAAAPALAVGQKVVLPVSPPLLPDGLNDEVVDIAQGDGTVSMTLRSVSLGETVAEADIDLTAPIDYAAIDAAVEATPRDDGEAWWDWVPPGDARAADAEVSPPRWTILPRQRRCGQARNGVVVIDDDGNLCTTNDQLVVDPSLSIELGLQLRWETAGCSLPTYALVRLVGKVEVAVALQAQVSYDPAKVESAFESAMPPDLFPRNIRAAFDMVRNLTPGPVTVDVEAPVRLPFTATGSFTARAGIEFDPGLEVTRRVNASRNACGTESVDVDMVGGFTPYGVLGEVSMTGSFRPHVAPRFTLKVARVVGPFLELPYGVEVKGGVTSARPDELWAQVEPFAGANAGVVIEDPFFGFDLFEQTLRLTEVRRLVAHTAPPRTPVHVDVDGEVVTLTAEGSHASTRAHFRRTSTDRTCAQTGQTRGTRSVASGAEASITDDGPWTAGTEYRFCVRLEDELGQFGPWSEPVDVVVVPDGPVEIAAFTYPTLDPGEYWTTLGHLRVSFTLDATADVISWGAASPPSILGLADVDTGAEFSVARYAGIARQDSQNESGEGIYSFPAGSSDLRGDLVGEPQLTVGPALTRSVGGVSVTAFDLRASEDASSPYWNTCDVGCRPFVSVEPEGAWVLVARHDANARAYDLDVTSADVVVSTYTNDTLGLSASDVESLWSTELASLIVEDDGRRGSPPPPATTARNTGRGGAGPG